MDKDRIIYLYECYRDHVATTEERKEFISILSDPQTEEVLKASWDENWDQIAEEDLNGVTIDRYEEIYGHITAQPQQLPVKERRLWTRIAAAASIALVIGSGIYFFSDKYKASITEVERTAHHHRITPGRNAATLTLANGKKIFLSDAVNGELAKEAGVRITKTVNGQVVYEIRESSGAVQEKEVYNSLTTARGEQYQVLLPDGSKVWLNAASTLIYPVSFATQKARKVELIGEAYFEVAKDKQHPFKVKSAGQEVEVLGTHFNVNSYSDEPVVKTTLLEGSVRVSFAQGREVIKPGQQAILMNDKLSVIPVDLESAVAWKNGYFSFNNEDMKSVMRKISRWYDVEIEYQKSLSGLDFTGRVSRSGNINEVLNLLELTGVVHFKLEGRRIIVMP